MKQFFDHFIQTHADPMRFIKEAKSMTEIDSLCFSGGQIPAPDTPPKDCAILVIDKELQEPTLDSQLKALTRMNFDFGQQLNFLWVDKRCLPEIEEIFALDPARSQDTNDLVIYDHRKGTYIKTPQTE